jgi:hypothetical protein
MADRKITDLTELTAPAADDLLPIVDSSEATAANKNKKIQYGTFLRNLPSGTVGAPSLAWTADTGVTGIYRSAANELAFTTNSTFAGKFSTTGFQLGTGTAAAQLHLFSSDTTDQVIIENTDAGLDTAPDVVLYRNSASPANNDNLGNLEFRGKDSGGNDHAYAQILSTIGTVTDTAEVGILDLMTANASAPAMRLRLRGANVGISEATPLFPLHVSSTVTSTALQVQATNNDSASGADITLYRRRGASTVGQNGDLLSTVYFRGHNDNATTEQVDYAAVEGSIVSVTNNSENGQLSFKVQKSGTLTTQLAITNANVILSARPILPTASPASTGTGVTGEVTWDSAYLYVCVGTDTWKKVNITTTGVPGSTAAFGPGSATDPTITFTDDANTGIYSPGADQVSVTTGGVERIRFDSTGQLEAVSLGTAAAPTFSFTGDPNTGVYSPGADQLAITTGGTVRLTTSTTGITSALALNAPLGTAAAPTYSFTGDLNTGIYSPGADQVGIATNGVVRFTTSTTAFTGTLPWQGQNGSAATPAFSFSGDTNTGIYSTGTADQIAIGTNGTERLLIGANGLHTINASAQSGAALTTTAPAKLYTSTGTYTDTATAASGTVAHGTVAAFDNPAIAATNTGVVYTNASTVYIDGAPTNGTNVTITNPFALFVAAGNSRFGGNVLSSSATGGVGYATGAGGAVTQATSRTTGVTLNTICGAITLVSAAGTATWQSFTVTNSAVAISDTVIVKQRSGTDLYMIHVTNIAAGSFRISFATTGGTTTEQPVFNFSVIKAVAA